MKVRINKNEPTPAQREVLKAECRREFNKLLEMYNYDTAIQVIHILHFDFGFGQQRLNKFAEKLKEMQVYQKERYELPDSDTPWLCEKQLTDAGINLDGI